MSFISCRKLMILLSACFRHAKEMKDTILVELNKTTLCKSLNMNTKYNEDNGNIKTRIEIARKKYYKRKPDSL